MPATRNLTNSSNTKSASPPSCSLHAVCGIGRGGGRGRGEKGGGGGGVSGKGRREACQSYLGDVVCCLRIKCDEVVIDQVMY